MQHIKITCQSDFKILSIIADGPELVSDSVNVLITSLLNLLILLLSISLAYLKAALSPNCNIRKLHCESSYTMSYISVISILEINTFKLNTFKGHQVSRIKKMAIMKLQGHSIRKKFPESPSNK